MAEQRRRASVWELELDRKLSPEGVETALKRSSETLKEALADAGAQIERIDVVGNKTTIFLSGSKTAVEGLAEGIRKEASGAEAALRKSSAASLRKPR